MNLLLPLLAAALAASPEAEAERLAVLVDTLRPVAEALVIDGDRSDWGGLYQVRQQGTVRMVSVAPTDTHLNVVVELSSPLGDDALWIALDTGRLVAFEASLRIDRSGVRLRDFAADRLVPVTSARVARSGAVVEISVPWVGLHSAVSGDNELSKAPGAAVRVRATRWRRGVKGGRKDPGLAVASYVLGAAPPVFDPPRRASSRAGVVARFPLEGPWMVVQGAYEEGRSHATTWAYDFACRDIAHRSGRERGTAESMLAFGKPIVAPGRGTVRVAIDGHDDRPLSDPGPGKEANRVALDLDDGTRVVMLHLRKGSVRVRKGQRVQAGAKLGEVGNSGMSTAPHLHAVWTGSDGRNAPALLHDVVVGLNLGDDDPWARHLDGWHPSTGYFVRAIPASRRVPR